ncbi:hypothetical protein J6590_025813 [Homalodisca vitripennis]|nr:hypothetical protein J6590_025813 [Homalodisca vitripennis]
MAIKRENPLIQHFMTESQRTLGVFCNYLGTHLQKKWKSVKDCYNRERRRLSGGKSGSAANRKTPYIYYHMLSFLNSNNPPTNTHSNVSHPPDEDDIDLENTQLDQGPESETPTATTATAEPYATRVTAKKRKPEDNVGQQLVKILKESADERRRHDTEVGCDEDRLFLLSLVSNIKKVPDHLKLSVRRQIINIIEQNTVPTQHYPTPNTNYSQGYSTNYSIDNNFHFSQQTSPPQSTGRNEYNSSNSSPVFQCFEQSE